MTLYNYDDSEGLLNRDINIYLVEINQNALLNNNDSTKEFSRTISKNINMDLKMAVENKYPVVIANPIFEDKLYTKDDSNVKFNLLEHFSVCYKEKKL